MMAHSLTRGTGNPLNFPTTPRRARIWEMLNMHKCNGHALHHAGFTQLIELGEAVDQLITTEIEHAGKNTEKEST